MNRESCFELGYTLKPHGLKGDIEVKLDVDYPEAYIELESVFVEQNGRLVPFFIEDLQLKPNGKARVKFEEVDTFEDAEKLKSCPLFLPLELLPALDEGQFYFHEVVGYEVLDTIQGSVGTISGFVDGNAYPIMLLDHKGKEILVPVTNEIVNTANHEAKTLEVTLPEGLIDVYLSE